ncbi:MAG: hypothetical protein K0S12_226, partial [Bacteroidetes bacterium]|nr:hypothetical protein [Bacteroidota bacterium]
MIKHTIPLFLILLLTACSPDRKEIEQAEAKYQSLVDSVNRATALHDSSLNALLSAFNEVELNLDSVARKQNVIALNLDQFKGDLRADVKSRINSQIEAINELMDQNEKKISDLNRKLKNSNLRVKEFRNTISLLNDQIVQKNTELEAMNDRLAKLHIEIVQLQVSVDTLSSQNYEQSLKISEQTGEIHRAWYAIGKSRELADKKIIDKNGGVLGIGRNEKLSQEFNPDKFTQIDYTQTV